MLEQVQVIIDINKKTGARISQLREENEKRAQLICKRTAKRDIENLMGRFAILYSAGQYNRLPAFFADTEQICFQRSDVGVYEGKEAICGYFKNLADRAVAGSFRFMNLTSPVIQMAEDGKTAQGMWYINGMEAIKNPEAPVSPAADMWINDKLAVEFIRTNKGWKILRMTITEEMRGLYHKSWGEYSIEPEYPAFDTFPAPTRKADCHLPFRHDRKSQRNLITPEPYGTYQDLEEHF